MKRYALVCCDNESSIELTLHKDYQSARRAMIDAVKDVYESLHPEEWNGYERAIEADSYELLDRFQFQLISICNGSATVGYKDLPPVNWRIFDLSKMA